MEAMDRLTSWNASIDSLRETNTSPLTPRNILFATDLSPEAGKALPYAKEIARRYGATIYAVHVIRQDVYPFELSYTWPLMAEAEEHFRGTAKQELEKALQGISHELIFEEGQIWPTLSQILHKKKIDLLVLGTHGRSGIGKVMMGSVAEQLFRQATCPVLTVGPRVRPIIEAPRALNRILYATDFSLESLAAAQCAISVAKENRARLILLHCVHRPKDLEPMLHALRQVVPLGVDLLYPPNCIVECGSPGNEILQVSEQHGVDLIVLGIRSADWRLAAASHFANSTAYKVVTQANCPVLTLRG
jgi:nucleotide-binding universal stress UspA family protein